MPFLFWSLLFLDSTFVWSSPWKIFCVSILLFNWSFWRNGTITTPFCYMLRIRSWRPWQKVCKKQSWLLDLVSTFCLNLCVVFKNKTKPQQQQLPKQHYKERAMKPSPNSVIPPVNKNRVPAGDPGGVTQGTGLEAVQCCAVVSKILCLFQASWRSHVPNVHFALLVARFKAVNVSISTTAALAQLLPHCAANYLKSEFRPFCV